MKLLLLPLLLSLVLAGKAFAADPVQSLHGQWKGDEMNLAIDVERGQGRVDPEKPFQWERFIVKSVADSQVVFTIGPRLYVATIVGSDLLVEAAGFPGPQRLTRIDLEEEGAAASPAIQPPDSNVAAPPGPPPPE